MDFEHWELVKEVLDDARHLDSAERAAHLENAGLDEVVRREVVSLLAQEDVEVPLLEKPIFPILRIGQQIGPYEVLRLLGEGGMGTVVLAKHRDLDDQVALKLLHSGLISAKAMRRFRDERQLLARLEHPNIAHIRDAGTTDDGWPYFAMEYVQGKSLRDYCHEQEISVDERLDLFLQICDAVQFAHQKLIVHCDLKPSNILVTVEGKVKLLDFGIAKQLADTDAPLTVTENRPLTFLYASPEQIRGHGISTASDIYSLGVVLYQLLTGRYPYVCDLKNSHDVVQAVCSEEPRKPSTAVRQDDRETGRRPSRLRKKLKGDLDSILLKALQKKPEDRYSSVEQFSEDLRHHLNTQPVKARDATFPYLAKKFVRRYRWAFLTGTVLIAFAALALLQWIQAVRERERREVIVEVMSDLFWVPILKETRGQERRTRRILESSLGKIDLLEPPLQAEVLQATATAYAELDNNERALELRERSVGILRVHYGDQEHPDLARAINNQATSHYLLEQYENAERLYREALAMKRLLLTDNIDLAKSLSNLATILMSRGDLAEAEPLYREALEIREREGGPEDPDVATSLRSLANLFYLGSEIKAAEPLLNRALEVRRKVYGVESEQYAAVLSTLGRVLYAQGKASEAEALFRQALENRLGRYGDGNSKVAATQVDLALLHLDKGQLDSTEKLLTAALGILRQEASGSWQLYRAESGLGALRMAQERYSEAKPLLLKSAEKLAEFRGDVIYTWNARQRLLECENIQAERSLSNLR